MTKEKKTSTTDYDKEAYTRYLCRNEGFGCGTNPKKISDWRKEKTWEERCRDFHEHDGD